jgi:hypothetical protein
VLLGEHAARFSGGNSPVSMSRIRVVITSVMSKANWPRLNIMKLAAFAEVIGSS